MGDSDVQWERHPGAHKADAYLLWGEQQPLFSFTAFYLAAAPPLFPNPVPPSAFTKLFLPRSQRPSL